MRLISLFLCLSFVWLGVGIGVPASAQDQVENQETKKNPNPLFVFIGKKITLQEFEIPCPPNRICMDAAFRAHYQILQTIYGEFDGGDQIEFTAYDHYGTPQFGQHQEVMLFVTKISGQWYHVKYQFFPVNPTKDGDWAFCGNPYGQDKDTAFYRLQQKALQAIDYAPELKFDFKRISEASESDIDEVARRFPSPIYETKGHSAVCKMGVRARDLLEVMKQTVLKQRGFF